MWTGNDLGRGFDRVLHAILALACIGIVSILAWIVYALILLFT